MISTQLLRRRIKTAQNVSKTTRAMQMIAASKLKRAQDATLAGRPYVQALVGMSKTLTGRVNTNSHPYFRQPTEGKKLLVVFAPDKGLCGPLVTNLAKELFARKKDDYVLLTVGKKVEGYASRLQKEVVAAFPFKTTLPTFETVFPIAKIIEEQYMSKKVVGVELIYTHFTSVFYQKTAHATILPLTIPTADDTEDNKNMENLSNYTVFEPSAEEIITPLLKHYLEMTIYQYLLESFVSEQGARMIAMQNATDNAKEIVSELTLSYNKARQAKITSEILDISSSMFIYA